MGVKSKHYSYTFAQLPSKFSDFHIIVSSHKNELIYVVVKEE